MLQVYIINDLMAMDPSWYVGCPTHPKTRGKGLNKTMASHPSDLASGQWESYQSFIWRE